MVPSLKPRIICGARDSKESLLHEKYPGIQILDTAEHRNNAETCHDLTLEFLKRYPRLNGIYVAEGGYPSGASRRVSLVCHDLVDETMRYLIEGVVTATIGQDPFAQGHDTVINLFNHLAAQWAPKFHPARFFLRDVSVKFWPKAWKTRVGCIIFQGE